MFILVYTLFSYVSPIFSCEDGLNNFNCPNGTGSVNGSVKTPLCTGKIWATYPNPDAGLSLANGFFDQVCFSTGIAYPVL